MRKIVIKAALACVGITAPLLAQTGSTASKAGATAEAVKYRAFLDKYCVACHSNRAANPAEGPVNLESAAFDEPLGHAETWERVLRKLSVRAMPPPGLPRPSEAEYAGFTSWLAASLDRAWEGHSTPGRYVVHRLNRAEYANAVRDLIGIQVDASTLLPPDEQAFGFDTNADALLMQPALLDRYLSAAAKIARLAIGDRTIPPEFERYGALKGDSNEQTYLGQTERLGEDFPLGSRGGIAAFHYFPLDGEYVIKLRLQRTNQDVIRGLDVANQIEIRVAR